MVNPDDKIRRYDPSDESSYVAEDEDVKPVTAPQPTNKDFKKVLGRMRKEGKEEEDLFGKKKSPDQVFGEEASTFASISELPSKDDEENASEEAAAPMSLFELSKSNTVKEEPVTKPGAKSTAPVQSAVESPSDLFKRMATKETSKPPAKAAVEHPAVAHSEITAPHSTEAKKDKFTTRYTPEQTDLSYVNPLAANLAAQQPAVSNVAETKAVERPKGLSPAMQELVSQIVKTMYTVETKGKTDTIITLQYPPQFKDVNLVVTAYDSARGQFNLSFENLTQSAKHILDLEDNRKALVAALEQRGYGVQIVQTTTLIEHPVPASESGASREGRDQNREEDQSDQRERRNSG